MSDNTIIRSTTLFDEAAVSALLTESYPVLLAADYAPTLLDQVLPVICRARPSLLDCGTYYVVQSEAGLLLSCGGWTMASPNEQISTIGAGHIRHFATHPNALRRGHARRILQRCLTEARAAGLDRIHCASTITAVPFYRELGFTTVAYIDVELNAGLRLPSAAMVHFL